MPLCRELVSIPKRYGDRTYSAGGGSVGKKAKSFPGARVVSFKPEMRTCPDCGTKLRFLYVAGGKYVTTLTETIHAVSLGYRCPTDGCQGHQMVFP